MKKTIYIVVMAVVMSSCHWQNKKSTDVAVELNGQTLTYEQLDEITRTATSASDSAAWADAYIEQWASDILEYAEAKDRATPDLEQLVEDYRRSLYVHAYEQKMVTRRKPRQWPDSLVNAIYESRKEHFRLKENIVKGVFLVVPQGTPQLDQAKQWLSNLTDQNIENIEKYAYQYATGYEYFVNEWRPMNQLLLWLPSQTDINNQLIRQKQIVVEDSISVYMLQVTNKYLKDEIMPKDYARESIEQLLLNEWKIQYIQSERKKLYEDAVNNKLKRYEK